jgi:general secretion pathway protein D
MKKILHGFKTRLLACVVALTALICSTQAQQSWQQNQNQQFYTPPVSVQQPTNTLPPLPTVGTLQTIKDSNDINDDRQEANIFLNFENVSLSTILNYLAEQKSINVLPNKDLEAAKVSISTRTPLTLDRAWNVLLTLMESNGFSIVLVNGVYRVIPTKDNSMEVLPIYSSVGINGVKTEPEDLPQSDLVIRYAYFFKNIKAETAQGILRTMLPDEKGVMINRDLNMCFLKDQSLNIKAAMKIVKALDVGGLSESIKIIKLKHTNAETVGKMFEEMISANKDERTIRFTSLTSQRETSYFSSNTRIIPEPIQNMLILLGTEKNINKLVEFIGKYIDVPIGDADSRLHIKEIRYAKAEALKPILDNLVKAPPGQTSDKSTVVGDYKFFEDVTIAAETPKDESSGRGGGNRLIIACNRDDWTRLEKFIDKLDKPQPQVAVEVMIIDVGIDQLNELGAQTFNIMGRNPGMGINEIEFKNLSSGEIAPASSDATKTVAKRYIDLAQSNFTGINSPSFMTIGRSALPGGDPANENIWSIIRAVYKIKNFHVVSQPFVVINNYQTTTIDVGQTRRVPGDFVSNKGEPSRVQRQEVKASTKIDITPQINIEGLVDLKLEVTIDEFKAESETEKPEKITRNLKTKVSMATGEVIVLGGLTKNNQSETVYKTPILGDIPIIGNLFRSKSKSKTDANLYVFIRPSIIKPQFACAPDEYTQLKLDYAKYQVMRNDTYAQSKDPIERWFFKPSTQSIKHCLEDSRQGIFRPIDNFTSGIDRPKSVNIQEDPYFSASETIKKVKDIKSEHQKQKKSFKIQKEKMKLRSRKTV